jgi:hypothetical protein
MTDTIEEATRRIAGLEITEDTPEQQPTPATDLFSDEPTDPEDAINKVIEAAQALYLQSQRMKDHVIEAKEWGVPLLPVSLSLKSLSSDLTRLSTRTQQEAESLEEAKVSSVVKQVVLLRNPKSSSTKELLAHFDDDIRKIAREIVSSCEKHDVLWKLAERCFDQASRPSGSLNVANYFCQ